MKRLQVLAAGVAGAVALLAGQAQASTFLVTYTATNGGTPVNANLALTASDTANNDGGFNVTGITGDVDGDTLAGLIANPTPGQWSYSGDGMFMIDNVVYSTAPNVSWYGLLFAGASGNEYNLFSDNPSTYELYRAQSGVGYLASSIGTVTAQIAPPPQANLRGFGNVGSAAPEPGAWALMIMGFGAVGAALRRRASPALA